MLPFKSFFILFGFLSLIFSGFNPDIHPNQQEEEGSKWVSIFNGKDLDGWFPKFAGYEFMEDPYNTFRAEDGVLKVSYAEYDTFRGEFGHLFYKKAFSHYRLRLEYRFVGEQAAGGAGWAYRNNGIMFHAQPGGSMEVDQAFPVSLEFQLLGGDGSGKARPTGNLCTPGTNVYLADTLAGQHCIQSSGPTIDGDEWVKAELYVDRDRIIHHIINGDTVLTYTRPVIGGRGLPEDYPAEEGTPVDVGYIALQAETTPTEFRKIEIMVLD